MRTALERRQDYPEVLAAEEPGKAKADERNQNSPVGQARERGPVPALLRGQRECVHPAGAVPKPKHERAAQEAQVAKAERADVAEWMTF